MEWKTYTLSWFKPRLQRAKIYNHNIDERGTLKSMYFVSNISCSVALRNEIARTIELYNNSDGFKSIMSPLEFLKIVLNYDDVTIT
jgi:hypothetical protein